MSTPRRLAVQSRCRCMDYSRFVSADEVDAGWMRHSGREVIERPGDFRLWHETVMVVRSPQVCCPRQSGKHLLGVSISYFDPKRSKAVPGMDRLILANSRRRWLFSAQAVC